MRVAIYTLKGNGGSSKTCPAMEAGARRFGYHTTVFADTQYCPEQGAYYDVAVFWGYVETLQAVMRDYSAAGKPAVYLDLGYWKRDQYFKVSVNARHPTAYFQRRYHDDVRRKLFGVEPQLWRKVVGGHILLAGMGAKAAWAEKLEPVESFEREVVKLLKMRTDRPIVYRPKPSWSGAKPIEGTRFSPRAEPLEELLANSFAVVTHHSNVAVDGLVAGVPAFALQGVAAPMGSSYFLTIGEPFYPHNREQWLNDVAYCQWSLDEMRDGTVWRHLKDEGLIP